MLEMSTGTVIRRLARSLSTSRPLDPGREMSNITALRHVEPAFSSSSAPVEASATARMSGVWEKATFIPSRTTG